MIYREELPGTIREPMIRYCSRAKKSFSDWEPLLLASEKLLAGGNAVDDEIPDIFAPIVKFMAAVIEEEE